MLNFKMFSLGALCGLIFGFVLELLYSPSVGAANDCKILRVDRKTAVSYVLKPPTVEPVIIKEKCHVPAPKVEEPEAEEIVQQAKDHEPRRRNWRHHRIRRYWR